MMTKPTPAQPSRFPWPVSPADEDGPRGAWLYRQLLDKRIVLAQGRLDHDLATIICAQLLTLDAEGEEPIALHLHTPDGDLDATLTVLDTLDVLRVSVHAVAVGTVGGPCLAALAAADERVAYPHATFHLTEPRTSLTGTATEVAAHETHYRDVLAAFYTRLAQATGKPADVLREDARRGRYLTAAEALEYGLIDRVAERH
jgi:ATP-dependent Clp protease protease subunit